jgi:hypothetical protein
MATKNEIFERYKTEYFAASRARKGEILVIVCDTTRMHRKAATRKFRVLQLSDPAKQEGRGRKTYYDHGVGAALELIWTAASELCAELLHPVVGEYISILERDNLWNHSGVVTGKLLAMSVGTMKRRVGTFMKARRTQHGLSTTSPSHLKAIIPMFSGPWSDKPPGHGQLDTVVHSGDSLLGDMAYTLNYTDVATYWIVARAQWNKGQEVTLENMKELRVRMPFPWLEGHPDSGSEFINWLAKDWFEKEDILLTRSRPGKKNDNCYVEERNGHVIRKFLGYTRIDCCESVAVMNELYDALCPYLNHFVPSRRTKAKVRDGAKYKRTYEVAQTAYQRVLAHTSVSEDVKARLREEHATLNPLLMKKEIDRLITKIFVTQKCCGDPENSRKVG